jgi:hypothetical protein
LIFLFNRAAKAVLHIRLKRTQPPKKHVAKLAAFSLPFPHWAFHGIAKPGRSKAFMRSALTARLFSLG